MMNLRSFFKRRGGQPTYAGNSSGRAAVGSSASANDLRITSDGTLTTNASDVTRKANLAPLSQGLDKVLQLKPYSFNWKSEPDGPRHIGLIAQDVEKVIPEITFTNPVDNKMGINSSELPAVLVKAIQEQQEEIDKIQSELRNLKRKNEELQKVIETLQNKT